MIKSSHLIGQFGHVTAFARYKRHENRVSAKPGLWTGLDWIDYGLRFGLVVHDNFSSRSRVPIATSVSLNRPPIFS